MPTDEVALFELRQIIGNGAEDLRKAKSSLSESARIELVRNAERLAIAARDPEEKLYFQATQMSVTAQNPAIRTAIRMDVFSKVPSFGGGISASDLASALKVLLQKELEW